MRRKPIGAWVIVLIGSAYFLLPLIATLEFSLRMRRGVYSFDAYASVFRDHRFIDSFVYSATLALCTIVLGVLLIAPTAYWIRLKLPKLLPVVEFVTLMPLIIPPIILVFGYIRLYNSSSILPMTSSTTATNVLLVFGYTTLAMPYLYRAIDTGLRAVDMRTLTEAAESLGASRARIFFRIILPNIRTAILSGIFLTFTIALGEFVLASLLGRPAFGPYLQLIGANRAYEPAALAVISFAITWALIGIINLLGRARSIAAHH